MFEDTDSSLFNATEFVVEDCEDIGEGEIECYASQVEFVDQTDADGNTYTHVYVTPLDMTFTEETCWCVQRDGHALHNGDGSYLWQR